MKSFSKAKIISRQMLTEDICSLWAEVPFAGMAHAGQFVSFYLNDPSHLLPRPISICDISRRLGALRFVFRIVGEGTRQLAELRTGDEIEVLGPLGNGYPLEEASGKRLLLAAGGLGVPPMLGIIRDLYDEPCGAGRVTAPEGTKEYDFRTSSAASAEDGKASVTPADGFRRPPLAVTCALGYRHDLFLYDEISENTAVSIATDDGSSGVHGTVIDAIRQIKTPYDLIFACGPKPMLKALAAFAKEKEIPLWVSMEERMACGVGTCLGCVCKTTEPDPHYHVNYKRVCKDGPVFKAEELAELQ